MWLLSTDRAELKFFNYPEDVEEGYAILSHVWDEEETTFQEVQSLRTECAKKGVIPRESPDIGYKIRESCRLAERHGWKCIEPYFCIGVASHVKNRKNTMRKHIQSATTHVHISSLSLSSRLSRTLLLHSKYTHAIKVEAVAESYLNVGGICCLFL